MNLIVLQPMVSSLQPLPVIPQSSLASGAERREHTSCSVSLRRYVNRRPAVFSLRSPAFAEDAL